LTITGFEDQVPGRNPSGGRAVPTQDGQPGDAGLPRPRPARVPRTVETVSAGAWFARMLRGYFALSQDVDDAERQYGPKLYDAMMNDPVAGSSVDVLRQAAVRHPTLEVPDAYLVRPGTEATPEEAEAEEVTAFCRRALMAPDRPFVETLYELSLGLVKDKMAEIVLKNQTEGPDAGRLTFRAFKFKPRDAWLYVVDPYGNVGFIAGRLPPGEVPPSPREAVYVPGTGGNAVLLEPDRFLNFAWGRVDSDPRCRPILRRAYNAWNLKVRTWPEKLKGDLQFGTPSVAATLAEDVQDPDPEDVAGLKLADGSEVVTAEDVTLYSLERLSNGAAAVFPCKTAIQVVESKRDGAGINESVALYNREIATAVLHAPRTTQEAQHGSKADTETATDITEILISLLRSLLAWHVRNALKTLVRLNFGPRQAEVMVPEVKLGEVGTHDLPLLLRSMAAWVTSGAPTPGQLPEIDAMLGLTPRRPDEPSLADVAANRTALAAEEEAEGAKRGGVPDEEDEDDDGAGDKAENAA
jgi:hypothetical protein